MSFVKKSPIIISGVLAFLVLVAIVMLSLISKNGQRSIISDQTSDNSGPMSNESYQIEAQTAVQAYELYIEGEKSLEEVMLLKEHLLTLKISREYQDLHLKLVMIADELQINTIDYLKKDKLEASLSDLYLEYPWLKN